MNIKYDNCHHDTQSDQHHCEQQIFAEQRECQWCRWYNLGYQQKEHSLRQQYWNAQSNFFTRIGRQIKHQYRQIWNADAWNNQVYRVEQCLATQCNIEENIYKHRMKEKYVNISINCNAATRGCLMGSFVSTRDLVTYRDMVRHSMGNIFHGVRLAHPKYPIPRSDKIHVNRCPTRLCYRSLSSDLYASNQSEKRRWKERMRR